MACELVYDNNFANYYSLSSVACNRTLTASSGRILSPRWPGYYPANSRCNLLIIRPPGEKLSLFFNALNIEFHSGCNYDYLEVSEPIVTYCFAMLIFAVL